MWLKKKKAIKMNAEESQWCSHQHVPVQRAHGSARVHRRSPRKGVNETVWPRVSCTGRSCPILLLQGKEVILREVG